MHVNDEVKLSRGRVPSDTVFLEIFSSITFIINISINIFFNIYRIIRIYYFSCQYSSAEEHINIQMSITGSHA